MEESTTAALVVVFLICILAGSSLGYIIGSSQGKSFQSTVVALSPTVTETVTATVNSPTSGSPGSVPVTPDPYDYTDTVSGSSVTWYVPVVFLAIRASSQLYVNYNCNGQCPGLNPDSIASPGLNSLPQSFTLESDGRLVTTFGINFSSSVVVYYANSSETITYELTIGQNGYFTFSLPYGCTPEPIIYVKEQGTIFNYDPVVKMLRSTNLNSDG